MWLRIAACLALTAGIACGDGGATPAGDAGPGGERPAAVLRVLAWPGGGLQAVVELPARAAALPAAWIEVGGDRIDAEVEPAGLTAGMTAILVVPGATADAHARRVGAALALVDALPAGERIAILAGREEAVLLAELSADRAHARARLEALEPGGAGSAAALVDELRAALASLESPSTTIERSLIVVGEVVDEAPPDAPRPVQTLSFDPALDPAASADEVVRTMRARRAAIVRVGACAALDAGTPVTVHVGDAAAPLAAPEPLEHLADQACAAGAAAADAYPFVDEIDLRFSPPERAVFDQRVAGPSEEPFRTSVALGAGAPLPAEAHLRGSSSLGCERKSFAVTLDGSRRRLAPDLAADRFFLISMCLDLRYFGQVFGDRLLGELGFFPAATRFVRLRIDGVNQGVYLLVHRPDRALRDVELGVTSVVRRGYDVLGQPGEVKFPREPAAAEDALARFESLGDLALSEPPETLAAALDQRLDLDAYLRMVALFSLLENGDYIDEVYFSSSLEDGAERYTFMGWDTDDILSACHGGGDLAIADTCGVTYCAESELDHALLRSTEVYGRYLAQLAAVMDAMSPAHLAEVMAAVRGDLWRVLDDDETAAALTELVAEDPEATTVAAARADITATMAAALGAIEDRRAALATALDACPQDASTSKSDSSTRAVAPQMR